MVIRKIVSDALAQDPSIEVIGVAANGKIALQKIPTLKPDILTLDVEMPEMDGLETLDHLAKDFPNIPVIMFSTLTQRGAAATLDALAKGASDYVGKPSNVGNVLGAIEHIRNELVPKIKNFCSKKIGVQMPTNFSVGETKPGEPVAKTKTVSQPAAKPATPVFTAPEGGIKLAAPPMVKPRVDIVAIGVSTGGPNALSELMPTFPADFPVPIVIVQHMPPHFTKLLADRLSAKSELEIMENQPGLELLPGRAILAAGDYHMTLRRDGNRVLTLANQDPPENSCRPAVDVLFRSVAELYGSNVLSVILTGMGQDGLHGCEEIRKSGGRVFTQDEKSSVVWGMPGFVSRAGLSEKILPLSEIGAEVVQQCKKGRPATLSA